MHLEFMNREETIKTLLVRYWEQLDEEDTPALFEDDADMISLFIFDELTEEEAEDLRSARISTMLDDHKLLLEALDDEQLAEWASAADEVAA